MHIIVSDSSDDGDSSPLYLILMTDGAVPSVRFSSAVLVGEPLVDGDDVSPFLLGDACFNRGGEGLLLSNDPSLVKPPR